MTFEGFNGKINKETYSVIFTLKYEGEAPDKKQKEKDLKDMGDWIALAFAHYAESEGDSLDIEKESGNTFHFGD